MMKRILAFALAAVLAAGTLPAAIAEELEEEEDFSGATISEQEMEELLALDQENEEEEIVYVVGEVYQEPSRKDFNTKSPAIYTCKVKANYSLFSERDVTSTRVYMNGNAYTADVLFVGSAWAILRAKDGSIGYIKRDHIYNVTPIDKVNTPPYGVQKSIYLATTATTCHVRKSMSDQDDNWVVLNPGTMLSIWRIQDGWAIVPYWRTYGYIDMNELTDLIPVSPTDNAISCDTPIAAYTSYYSMSQDEINLSRLVNIEVACRRLTRVMQPKEVLNFNANVGPYRPGNGYQQAWVLINGTSKPGYGGGTCQVSSTLYNALMQLPGIEILQRRPHGPSGAKYLPHGVDAAVGSDSLNLRFQNHYEFPIRVEGHTSNDGALLMVIYRADTMLDAE